MIVRIFVILAAAGLVGMQGAAGCAPCTMTTCDAERLVDALAADGDASRDRRTAFAALEKSLQLGPCPEGKAAHDVLCAWRRAGGRDTELRAELDPADPRESRYTLALTPGRLAPGLGAPFGRDLADRPGWIVGGGLLAVHDDALSWSSPALVGDPLDRLEAAGLPAAPRWGEVRHFLAVGSRWRDERDPLRRTFEFSPRSDDDPRASTRITARLHGAGGEGEPGDEARVDAVEIAATRVEARLDPTWAAAWLRDLRFEGALPALEAVASQPAAVDCVRAAKHGNFAVTWTLRRQGVVHVHTITAARRLVARQEFVATPYVLCDGSRGVFTR